MARKRAQGKISTINRATPAAPWLLERYCRGLENWPRSWMAWEKDLVPGEKLVNCFRPFLEELARSDLSTKTIQKHVDNLWALGGHIIRDLNEDPSLRRRPIEHILEDKIDEEGGPLVFALESEELLQRSLDATCKKLYRFRNHSPRR
jgi:hypothetical protein